jgi:hypothetical protein
MTNPPHGDDRRDDDREQTTPFERPVWGGAPDREPGPGEGPQSGQRPTWVPPGQAPSGQAPPGHPPYGQPQYGQPQGQQPQGEGGRPWFGPPGSSYGQPQGQQPPGQYGGQHGQAPYGGQFAPGTYGQAPYGGQYGGQYGPGTYGQTGQQFGGPYPAAYPGPYAGPYGAPGQAAGAPAKKRRTGLLVGLLALVAVVVVAVVALATNLGGTRLDASAVQRDVAAQFQQREQVAVQLSCPDDMRVTVGRTYTCTGRTADGQDVRLTITITGEDAHYTWAPS